MIEICKLLVVATPVAFAVGTMWLLGAFHEWPNRNDKEDTK